MKAIDYLNAKMVGQDVAVPEHLYKYRPFDKYAFDMLEKGELFLCKAENLDDTEECLATLALDDYGDEKKLSFNVVEGILDFFQPLFPKENFEKAKHIVYQTLNHNGIIRANSLIDAFPALQALAPGQDISMFINALKMIPEEMSSPVIELSGEKMIALAYMARQEMGICSLSMLANSEQMWKDYADNSSGYCIEYEFDKDYRYLSDTYPVVYSDERKPDIYYAILYSLLGQFVYKMTNGLMNADKTHYIRLFLTKDKKKWGQQEEWRILGNANELIEAPKITSIRLGKNVSKENREKMEKFCAKRGIVLLE